MEVAAISPRTRQQNEALRAERRQQILEAAIALFARHGYDSTSVSMVAKAGGVSHGTVFLYFPTKEALFEAAVLEPLAEAERQFQAIARGGGSPLEQIRQMIREQILTFAQKESYVRLAHHVLGQRDRFSDLVPRIFSLTDRYARALGPVIAEGQRQGELGPGDPRMIAFAYFAYLNGVSLITDPPGSPGFAETLEHFITLGVRIFAPQKEGRAHVSRLSGRRAYKVVRIRWTQGE